MSIHKIWCHGNVRNIAIVYFLFEKSVFSGAMNLMFHSVARLQMA